MRFVFAFLLLATTVARAQSVQNPLRPTDQIRVKIQHLESLDTDAESPAYLSIRALLCVQASGQEYCNDLGSTEGLQMEARQNKDFEREDSKSMPALYSPTVSAEQIARMLATLPENLDVEKVFLKLQLRKTQTSANDDQNTSVVSFIRATLPSADESPTNDKKVLQTVVQMKTLPPSANYGATVAVLIHRPN